MADHTNAEVSDERLREPSLYAEIIAIVDDCSERMKRSGESHRMFAKWVSEGVNALLTRRSVTSQASEGEPSLPRMDDIAAASIKYICADCAREESEYSCHSIEDVVIINDEVICLDHAKELHADQQRRKAPDVAAKLRRQRMSIATYQKAAENAPVSKRVERLETALRMLVRRSRTVIGGLAPGQSLEPAGANHTNMFIAAIEEADALLDQALPSLSGEGRP